MTDPTTFQYKDTFGGVLTDFEKLIGQDYKPTTDYDSAEAVKEVLDETVQKLDVSERLKTLLGPYVDILFMVSATLWEDTQSVSLAHGSLPQCYYCTLTTFPSASLAAENDLFRYRCSH